MLNKLNIIETAISTNCHSDQNINGYPFLKDQFPSLLLKKKKKLPPDTSGGKIKITLPQTRKQKGVKMSAQLV